MKVLLINPCRTYPKFSRKPTLTLPLGLLYIASVLERESINVKIFDCLLIHDTSIQIKGEIVQHGITDEEFSKALLKYSADVVGITCPFTAQLENHLNAAKLARKIFPDALIISGGPHFSVVNKSFLEDHTFIDCYISGEGEIAMLKLVKALQKGESFSDINGITYRESANSKKRLVKSNPPKVIEDLDSLPLPAYHLIDMEMFFKYQKKGLKSRPYKELRAVSLITSRGCPFGCIFCSIHLHMGKKIRVHSVDSVISHITFLINIYRIRHIEFEDDNLTYKEDRTISLFKKISKMEKLITWNTPNGIRADTLRRSILEIMKRSGCIGLTIAPESGDQDIVNKIIKKRLDLKMIVNVAKWCYELKIPLGAFYLIGFPGETLVNIEKTLDFAKSLFYKYDTEPMLSFAMPLLGTKLFDIVVNNGYNTIDITPYSLSRARSLGMIKTPEFSPEILLTYRNNFNKAIWEMRYRKGTDTLLKKITWVLKKAPRLARRLFFKYY